MNDNEVDDLMRRTLAGVARDSEPDRQLADRLIANARAGRQVTVPLHRRRSRRVMLSLLAAAAVVVAVATTATVAAVTADRKQPATQVPTPTNSAPIAPEPSTTGTPTHSSSSTASTSTNPPAGAQRVPVPAGFAASDVDAVSDSLIFAIGNAQCPSGGKSNCPALARSADGGSTWTRVTLPSGLVDVDDPGCGTNGNASGPCVRSVSFENASVGYVWSTRAMYATNDGGRTWTKDTTVTTVESVAVFADTAVRVVIPACRACTRVAQAATAGAAWSTVHDANGNGPSGVVQVYRSGSGFLLYVGDTDKPDTMYVSADGRSWTRPAASGLCSDPGVHPALDGTLFAECPNSALFRSTDGGATFRRIAATPGDASGVAAALDASTVLADSDSDSGSGGTFGLLVTRDAGQHWATSFSSTDYFDVKIESATHWYRFTLSGSAPQAFYSNDQGRSWHPFHVS